MLLSKLIGQRLREAPRDAQTASHIFLARGGYCRLVSAGLYSILPLGQRVIAKIEKIVREEMDRIGCQELKMPVVLPAELWVESGRFDSVGQELLRFKDRNDKDMILGMTHEEAVVQIARTELNSYKQLPAAVYQIQTKYRDEARPRAGLIRVREFTMKDAYSFHTSQESLEEFYQQQHEAYTRVFKRVGMKNCLSIESDSGMIGGKVSHEFMAIADCGEDTIFATEDGSYKANREVAETKLEFIKEEPKALEKVHTPGCKTIDDLASFLEIQSSNTCKAVFYKDMEGKLVFVCIRGDLEVNESKLKKVIGCPEIAFADDALIESVGAVPGFASLYSIDPSKVRAIVDRSAAESSNLVVGANEKDYHLLNFNYDRDVPNKEGIIVTDIATAREGDPSPVDGKPLMMLRGIEVGNIFQLGTKYSEPMKCEYLDQNGKTHPMIMGCYGIGIGRTAAAVIEQNHDDHGPIWPISIAPFQVHIIGLNQNQDQNIRALCEEYYRTLQSKGVEVLYDDRSEKAGSAFADADLIGVPLRIIVSPKTLAQDCVEYKHRDWERRSEQVAKDAIIQRVLNDIAELTAALDA